MVTQVVMIKLSGPQNKTETRECEIGTGGWGGMREDDRDGRYITGERGGKNTQNAL